VSPPARHDSNYRTTPRQLPVRTRDRVRAPRSVGSRPLRIGNRAGLCVCMSHSMSHRARKRRLWRGRSRCAPSRASMRYSHRSPLVFSGAGVFCRCDPARRRLVGRGSGSGSRKLADLKVWRSSRHGCTSFQSREGPLRVLPLCQSWAFWDNFGIRGAETVGAGPNRRSWSCWAAFLRLSATACA